MLKKDIADNRAIGANGAQAILQGVAKAGKAPAGSTGSVRVLTHCNTGSLATAGYGTALGVVRQLAELGKLGEYLIEFGTFIDYLRTFALFALEHVYCTETRPYNQGARLTAYELVHEKFPATLVLDSMVAALLRAKNVAAVVVGADRVSKPLND